jgi:hypothetical protein
VWCNKDVYVQFYDSAIRHLFIVPYFILVMNLVSSGSSLK